MELLSPAGSPEALTAAVQNGADAVYLGCGDFNARRRAKNFSPDDLAQAVAYCHVRGVRVYLTLNTLLTDRELPAALDVAAEAARCGVDAVLVQDLGLAAALKARCPGLPLHGSTQMTVHSLAGVEFCADLGMERVVLSRELSREAIGEICRKSPIEIEVFVHGALCMCYSGQCFLSAMVGTRSGNRGLCAQPCRLPYNGGCPLSLKDMSLAGHLGELADMGVACVKLEGRMKRPEYVAVVTAVYAAALREGREPTREELADLERVFSRSGFTQGYFTGEKGPAMFGTRSSGDVPDEDFYAAARATYQKERPLVPVSLWAQIRAGEQTVLTVRDSDGRTAQALAEPPQSARTRPLTADEAVAQLSKTGGTPYFVASADVTVEPGLNVPRSTLNLLRRTALDGLTAQRAAPPPRPVREAVFPAQAADAPGAFVSGPPRTVCSLPAFSHLSPALLAAAGGDPVVDLPLGELASQPALTARWLAQGVAFRAVLPPIIWDKEAADTAQQLADVAALGVRDALADTWDAARLAKDAGFRLWGGAGLGVMNSGTLAALKALGFQGATVSFEGKLAAIRAMDKPLPAEAVVYGRLPLMTLEQFPGGKPCGALKDRKNAVFPVVPLPGGRARLLNSQPLYLADKPEWKTAGLALARFLFTTESPAECVQILERYRDALPLPPNTYTRGLYYRTVE